MRRRVVTMGPDRGEPLDVEVQAATRGDEQAFSSLWRALNPALTRYLRVRAPGLAEDAAAETWLAVAAGIREFRGDAASFRGWLFTIARSKVVDEGRRRGRRPAVLVDDWTGLEPADPVDVAAVALESLATQDVLRLLGTLPQDQAEIVALRILAGLDAPAVGAIVGKSAGAVRVAQHRALRRLAAVLEAAVVDAEPPV